MMRTRLLNVIMWMMIACLGYAQAQETKEMTREEKKAEQEALDRFYFEEARKAIEDKAFVLEADQVMFKYGTTAFVSSNTNFVAVKGDEAVVQVAFNVPVSGPNGIGGVTVSGSISGYKKEVDKKGTIRISMNVMGTGISAQVDITLPEGGNRATVHIMPTFNSNRFTLSGNVLPMSKANVYQGRTL